MKAINFELVVNDLLDLALTFDTPDYIIDRLRALGLDDEQLAYLGFGDYIEGGE
jgi:hypothetical protein